MTTVYNSTIPDKLICEYLDFLINKVFALLPMFEDSSVSDDKRNNFLIYQNNLIQTINGNANLINYDNVLILDILSHLQSLFDVLNHDDYKRHVLKVCNLLSLLRKEVERVGI